MYRINYSNRSRADVIEIVSYIEYTLFNKTASYKFLKSLKREIAIIFEFPYSNPIFYNDNYKTRYRMAKVDNYVIFYSIDEINKTISVYRILYQKRNFAQIVV